MDLAAFTATCPYEIGDKLKTDDGNICTITDIACIHYLKYGTVEFRYELDNSGKYISFEVQK